MSGCEVHKIFHWFFISILSFLKEKQKLFSGRNSKLSQMNNVATTSILQGINEKFFKSWILFGFIFINRVQFIHQILKHANHKIGKLIAK